MRLIDVHCTPSHDRGWRCEVAVREGSLDVSRHRVRVTTAALADLGAGASSPETLVRASFEFLLEREPPSSILRSFDLTDIGRYFPEYEREIRRPS
jgi:hypothetical protein